MDFKNRNFGLDLVRFFAIAFVLIDHGSMNPFEGVLLGGLGVEIFFVLSGFLIGRILIRSFDQFEGFKTVKSFWVNRWFRTIPLYFVALVVQILLRGDWKMQYLYYFVFLQNNFYGISLYPVSWSLVIEEWFYLGLPFFFMTLLFVFKKVDLKGLLLGFLALVLFKFVFIELQTTPFSGVNGNPLLRFDTMLVGVILSWINIRKSNFYTKLANPLIFLLSLLVIITIQFLFFNQIGYRALDGSVLFKVFYFPLQSVLFALTIPFLHSSQLVNESLLKKRFLGKFITLTSILSYSFYLFHVNFLHGLSFLLGGSYSVLIGFVMLYPFSYLLYIYYERPMTRLREKFN